VYFNIPSNYTINDEGAKSVVMTISGNEKMWMAAMSIELADCKKILPYVILNWKTMPKAQLPVGLKIRHELLMDGWLSELMRDRLQVVCNRRPRALLKNWGMFVLDALKGHVTLNARSVIHATNNDLSVTFRGMIS
jgi:hypothetical protein